MSRGKSFDGQGKMIAVLKLNAGVRLTSKQIAKKVFELFPEDCEAKRNRSNVVSTDDELIGQIAAEFGVFWRKVVDENPNIQFIETRPREFYYDQNELSATDGLIPEQKELDGQQALRASLTEHDLYPMLGEILFTELRCFSMRIDEKASSNQNGAKGNRWLFPDVVGMIPLSSNWNKEVSVLADTLATDRIQLVSIEVKKDITRSDIREYFFQTVSNSAWANFAYLAAVDLKGNANDELTLLCSSYGIGFIVIDPKDLSNSQIKIPAQHRSAIDVNALNRLAIENRDAREFVENVSTFIKTGRLKTSDWDLVPDLKY